MPVLGGALHVPRPPVRQLDPKGVFKIDAGREVARALW
jgi:hypothetical protein